MAIINNPITKSIGMVVDINNWKSAADYVAAVNFQLRIAKINV